MSRVTLLRYWGSYFKSFEHAERIASYFAAARSAGWDCHLVMSQAPANAQWLTPLHRDGITTHHVRRPGGNFDAACIAATRRLCRRIGAHIMHCDNTHTSPMIGAALAAVPVRLWSKHAMQPAFEQIRQPTLRERIAPAVRTSATLASRVLPISRAIGDELVELGVSPEKIQVLPLPIAPVATILPAPDDAKRRWGFARDHFVVGTVGRSLPVKGWDLLLESFAAVHREMPCSRLLLVGSTSARDEAPVRESLDAKIHAAGLGNAVVFTGHLTGIGDALAAMDVFVLPSRAEGFSLALIEAMAAQRPVISTRVGIAPDIIVDGVHGLLVDRSETTGLTSALRRLGQDDALRSRLAAAAAGAVRQLPSPAQHAAALHDLYRSLLSRSGRSVPS